MSNEKYLGFMTLSHTILTVLMESPHTGYDLSKRFEESVSYFWKASQQQIYRELGKMEESGWVTHELISQVGKPDKKIFEITPEGKDALVDWFDSPTQPPPIREDLLVKVIAGPTIPTPILIKQIQERRSLHQAQLDRYLEKEAAFQQLPDPDLALRYRYLTLRRGMGYEREWISWCDEALEAIQQFPAPCREP